MRAIDGSGELPVPTYEVFSQTRGAGPGGIAELDVLNTELDAWTRATNTVQRHVDWRSTTKDARIKLRHLYPAL